MQSCMHIDIFKIKYNYLTNEIFKNMNDPKLGGISYLGLTHYVTTKETF